MILKAIIVAASLLSTSTIAPDFQVQSAVELQTIEAPAIQQGSEIPSHILTILIEDHCAPRFGLTTENAWNSYNDGELVITEIVHGERYRAAYQSGILNILLEDI